jgi:hypothetical protein
VAPSKSRALYFGSLPDTAGLQEIAAIVEPLGVIESVRLVRPKSCAFVNFHKEAVAHALQVASHTCYPFPILRARPPRPPPRSREWPCGAARPSTPCSMLMAPPPPR